MITGTAGSALGRAAATCMLLLAILCLVWELWLAPLRPGGSWLALKALPAVVPLAGLAQGRRYTFQWSCMLVLAYLAEGLVRAMADSGSARVLALAEIALAAAFFILALAYLRTPRAG